MAKAVFRPGEVAPIGIKVVLDAPFPEEKKKKEETSAVAQDTEDDDEIFIGPTPEELRAEAEKRRAEWDAEREALYNAAKAEIKLMTENAEKNAVEKIAVAESQASAVIEKAQSEAEKITSDADTAVAALKEDSAAKLEAERAAARSEGLEKGRKEGYEAGFAEVKRLAGRAQMILERLQDKRAEVISDAERQIVDLALLISRKVVKTISETQRGIVTENIREALARVKSRGNITIKVNLSDLQLAVENKDSFTKLMEGAGNIQILEDSSIDPGGCVIETDFGEVDARIAAQFAELEAKVLEISPIKASAKPARTEV